MNSWLARWTICKCIFKNKGEVLCIHRKQPKEKEKKNCSIAKLRQLAVTIHCSGRFLRRYEQAVIFLSEWVRAQKQTSSTRPESQRLRRSHSQTAGATRHRLDAANGERTTLPASWGPALLPLLTSSLWSSHVVPSWLSRHLLEAWNTPNIKLWLKIVVHTYCIIEMYYLILVCFAYSFL